MQKAWHWVKCVSFVCFLQYYKLIYRALTKSIFHLYLEFPLHTNRAERLKIFVQRLCYQELCPRNQCTATVPIVGIFCKLVNKMSVFHLLSLQRWMILTCSLVLIYVANSSNQLLNRLKFSPNYFSAMCSTNWVISRYSLDVL